MQSGGKRRKTRPTRDRPALSVILSETTHDSAISELDRLPNAGRSAGRSSVRTPNGHPSLHLSLAPRRAPGLFQQLLANWGSPDLGPDIDGKDKASLSAPYDVSVVVSEQSIQCRWAIFENWPWLSGYR
jgi:hypothetical protein